MSDVLKKKDFQKLLDDTVDALQDALAKAEKEPGEELAKADPGKETPAEKKPSGDSAEGSEPEKKEEGSKEPPKEEKKEGSAPPKEGGEESASDNGPPPAEGEAPPAAPEGEGQPPADPAAAMGEVSVESLQAEYEGMPLDQQKMHLLALKAAMMKAMMDQEAAPPAGAVPPGAPQGAPPVAPPEAAPPVAPPAAPPPVQKSDPAIFSTLEALKKSVEDLQKSVKEKDEIISGFGKAVEGLKGVIVSQRKAVTSVASLAKSEPAQVDLSGLTKEKVTQKLSEVAMGKLSKSDRDLIVSYSVGTLKDVSKIAHLLK